MDTRSKLRGSVNPSGFFQALDVHGSNNSYKSRDRKLCKPPTKEQTESNFFARSTDNASIPGGGIAAVCAETSFASYCSSEEVTASIQKANAIGALIGLFLTSMFHYFVRKYYRTGHYYVRVGDARPQPEDICKMNKDDILIYSKQNKIGYIVKGRGKDEIVEGEIEDRDDDKSKKADLDSCYFRELFLISALVESGSTPSVTEECKLAFLKMTAARGHTYSGKTSLNPLYRTLRALAKFGEQVGVIISFFMSAGNRNEQRLLSYVLSKTLAIAFGLFAIPYWLIREKLLKIPPNTPHEFDLTGLEGWSKYARTAQAIGTVIGQGIGGLMMIGAIQQASSAAAISFNISFWGGMVGVGSFVLAIMAVPLINWISSKFTRDGKGILTSNSKNAYRNNYTRSGLIIGAAIGVCLGLLIGNWYFDPIMVATICSAIGSAVGGIGLSIYGRKIHRQFHPLQPGQTEDDEDSDNSWDYASRSGASFLWYLGAAIACMINPAAALLVAPLGGAIASGIGWVLGLWVMRKARQLPGNEMEKKAETLPWSQRITTGANIGSIIGSALGLVIGMTGFVLAGPAGIIVAISFFGAIGAIGGGIGGVLYDKPARSLVYQGIKSFFSSSTSKPGEDLPSKGPSLSIVLDNSRSASPLSLLNSSSPSSSPSTALQTTAKVMQRAHPLLRIKIEDGPLHRVLDLPQSTEEKTPESMASNSSSHLFAASNIRSRQGQGLASCSYVRSKSI